MNDRHVRFPLFSILLLSVTMPAMIINILSITKNTISISTSRPYKSVSDMLKFQELKLSELV